MLYTRTSVRNKLAFLVFFWWVIVIRVIHLLKGDLQRLDLCGDSLSLVVKRNVLGRAHGAGPDFPRSLIRTSDKSWGWNQRCRSLGKETASSGHTERAFIYLMARNSLPKSWDTWRTWSVRFAFTVYQTEIDFFVPRRSSSQTVTTSPTETTWLGLLDKLLAHMGDINQAIFVNANIDKGSKSTTLRTTFVSMWVFIKTSWRTLVHQRNVHKSRPGFRKSAMISFRVSISVLAGSTVPLSWRLNFLEQIHRVR